MSANMTETPSAASEANLRAVSYTHSTDFPGLLAHLGISFLVTTYQAGKLAVVAPAGDHLDLKFHNFDTPMGVAVGRRQIAVGARRQVWFLAAAPDIARRLEPAGRHDACFVARSCHVTGEIHGHDMAWASAKGQGSGIRDQCEDDGELWIVNTLFSCLCTLDGAHSFVPRWRPPFITALAAEDRCHLNGLAVVDGLPRYVTVMGQTDTPGGWRPGKANGGCLLDVNNGATVSRGLCMPHSPRWHDGRLWLLDSGHGQLTVVEQETGRCQTVADLPGYTRGLAFAGPYAFVGLSKIRETTTFGGVPIAENRDGLKCGIWVVDCRSGRTVVFLEFRTGVVELFDVQVLPGIRTPVVEGPHAAEDGCSTIWIVPPLAER